MKSILMKARNSKVSNTDNDNSKYDDSENEVQVYR